MAPKRWQSNLSRPRRSSRRDRNDPFFSLPPIAPLPAQLPLPQSAPHLEPVLENENVPTTSFLTPEKPSSPHTNFPLGDSLQQSEDRTGALIGADENADGSPTHSGTSSVEQEEICHVPDEHDNESDHTENSELDRPHDATGTANVHSDSDDLLPLNWTTVTSLLGTAGTRRFTNDGYEMFCTFMKWMSSKHTAGVNDVVRDGSSWEVEEAAVIGNAAPAGPAFGTSLPCIRTIRRRILPAARKHAFVPTYVHYFPVDLSRSGSKTGVGTHQSSTTAPVRIVKPSDWAKKDLETSNIADIIAGNNLHRSSGSSGGCSNVIMDIEFSPIVRDRMRVLTTPRIRHDPTGFCFVEEGLPLNIVVDITSSLRGVLRRTLFQLTPSPTLGRGTIRVEVTAVRSNVFFDASESTYGVDCNVNPSRIPEPPRKKIRSTMLTKSPFRPGDILVTLRPPSQTPLSEGSATYGMDVIFRMDRTGHTPARDRIILFLYPYNSETGIPERYSAQSRQFTVLDIYSSGSNRSFLCEGPETRGEYAPPYGKLSDGRNYIVYRFLLYSDGFTPYSGRKGSMGGCYILPLGISPESRSRVGAIRRIGLTPPGISTNSVLEWIIPDIVKGTTDGFPVTTADGTEAILFLDCIGFVGDYPAVSEVLDVLGHTANAPCHLCSFTRYDKSGRGTSAYAYTSRVCSGHPSFIRTRNRVAQLRTGGVDAGSLRALGLQQEESLANRSQPLHDLSVALSRARPSVPLTAGGVRVVPSVLEPYRSCVIAPDHLFLGISQDIINCLLKLIPVEVRRAAHVLAREALLHNHLVYQKELFNVAKMEVHSMSVSAMYSLLLIAPSSFRNALIVSQCRSSGREKEDIDLGLDILESFQALVTRTQYRPDTLLDGATCANSVVGEHSRSFLTDLQEQCCKLVSKISTLCTRSVKAKQHLDKPNVHRLVEFYSFTLPAFGNVVHIQELVFERAHQELKRGVVLSNYHNPQLQAMDGAIGNDWINRLGIELQDVSEEGLGWTDGIVRSVLRLFGHPERNGEVSEELRMRVRNMFPPPVLRTVRSNQRALSSLLHTSYSWTLYGQTRRQPEAASREPHLRRNDWGELVREAKETLAALIARTRLPMSSSDEALLIPDVEVVEFNEAKWCVTYGSAHRTRVVLSTIRCGDVVQKVADSTAVSLRRTEKVNVEDDAAHLENPDIREMWMVAAILRASVEDTRHAQFPYILTFPCDINNGVLRLSPKSCGGYLMQLTKNVRRVMVLHKCTKQCEISSEKVVRHEDSIQTGGTFFPFGRFEGYPPRQS